MSRASVLMCAMVILVLALGVAGCSQTGDKPLDKTLTLKPVQGSPAGVAAGAGDVTAARADVKNLEKLLDEAETALAEARKGYPPASQQVQTAEGELRKVREQVRAVLLKELVPALRMLEAEPDILPNHPKMKELLARIAADRGRVTKLAARVAAVLTREDCKLIGFLALDLGNGVTIELVRIPAGEFTMGSENGRANEKPTHKVTISRPFYLGKYEVTQEQWEAVMGSNPSEFKGKTNPVESVSWNDCDAFLKKLNTKLKDMSYRLPTEAEWEYACRAGSATEYCFGDEERTLGDYAWYGTNSGGKTYPAGGKMPNAWGLYDMHGNVWEWCQDWYAENYQDGGQTDPAGPTAGRYRVLHGGAWSRVPTDARSAYREADAPDRHRDAYGLRVVVSGAGVD